MRLGLVSDVLGGGSEEETFGLLRPWLKGAGRDEVGRKTR